MFFSRHYSMCLAALLLTAISQLALAADSSYEFGFAKANITPKEALRLSGYGNRTEPLEGIDEQLWTRAMAIRVDGGTPYVWVSVDTIGLPGSLVESIAGTVEKEYGLPRAQFVVCFSHTHTAPHIAGGLTNIFSKPLTAEEQEGAKRYTDNLAAQIVRCVGESIATLAPGSLHFAEGRVTFAQNRRVLKEGKWAGFGVNPDGPVDHALPLLKIVDATGKVRGLVFNYACHCTTFGGDHNRVSGDWAGYAAMYLEQAFPGACALCSIGCGADANPPRDPNRATEFAQAEGKEILEEVQRLTNAPMQAITQPLAARFGYAELPIECPSLEDFKKRLDDPGPQSRQHAHDMLAIHQQTGQLPATYSAPVQVWRFGDQLSVVFLSGEVVVDYALRLKRELAPRKIWVSGYCNDLFAYVASERMRAEGGYEVDGSMIYYNQPGRWASGTEEILVRRIHELLRQ